MCVMLTLVCTVNPALGTVEVGGICCMESYNIDVASYTHMCVGLWTPSLFVRDYGRGLATRRGRESHPPNVPSNIQIMF